MEKLMKKLKKIYLNILGLPKTILFNFRYFPLRHAIRLPVFVSHRVWLMDLSGKVKISDIQTGAVKIGFGNVGIFDQHRSRTIWQVSDSGVVEFKGKAKIGHGSKISVTGNLSVGKKFSITAESSIVAHKNISIGDDVLVSWDSLIMDTDFHKIYDSNGNQTNLPMPVTIGNMVWVGCRSLILKGVNIADGVVVAAASTVNKSIEIPYSMVGGNPAKVIKEDIRWRS
jgi:acetyltransferase-like isoleucine patch superfamily enzyme